MIWLREFFIYEELYFKVTGVVVSMSWVFSRYLFICFDMISFREIKVFFF